MNMKEQLLT